jgi:K+-transporting ATPase KdpF subunit
MKIMENVLVGGVSTLLLIYLFWTLIRPEHF